MKKRLAIDAMGGDFAPQSVVEAVKMGLEQFPDIQFTLFGDETKIRPYFPEENHNLIIVHTTEKIDSGETDPVRAIRQKKTSSMVMAANAVKDGTVDAMISAGNTGALLASGIFVVGRIKQIERPGLMSTLPTLDGKGFDMLDLGANAENTARHLHNYAVIGSFYAEEVRGIKKPRVGLLNNGSEVGKGAPLQKEAYELIAADKNLNFIGNVEARDLLSGVADVVVADGFTGNAVLKSIEGTAENLMKQLKMSINTGGIRSKIGAVLMKKSLYHLKDALDYEKAGGAVLFGLKAPVVKSHGSSNADAILATIKQTRKMLETEVVTSLKTHYREENQ
ncbi:phosphate acyltransferase [Lactococcus hodotermopsidis]|uniref:Phosphate acyltransferase n=1 Tax=Pseudolactococcus hodotermopsidis TaxID=2709157 RepID=A0A6A0BA90_9LACT|nr:phosphate acyltransferase PlsX [Lactococcus hodotermopsidis]GFH41553.1 phosphate acyltransferase [Lactococcus hodotermopsidis]